MKQIKTSVILIILTIILVSLFIYNRSLLDRKNKIYEEFNQLHLLDIRGNVNLTEIESKKKGLEKEVNKLLKDNDMTVQAFDEEIDELKGKNLSLTNELTTLSKKIDTLNTSKDTLVSQYTVINSQYQAKLREREEEIRRNTIMIDNVPTINQYPSYPTGCESVALTILLGYYGINVSADEVINTLKKGEEPHDEEGIIYGGNPYIEFIGSPYSANSFGVYNNPIADVANAYKSGAVVRTGMPFNEVLELVKNKRPVVVWTSMNLAVPYVSRSWIYKPTGETISWKAQEHAVVLVGYNDDNVIISDPLSGTYRYQSRSVFESRYNYYGKMAVYY